MTLTLASIWVTLVGIIWVLSALFLILVVLVQKGKGGGLGSAFGGAAGSVLGTKTGDFLTWVTIVVTAVFLILGVTMNLLVKADAGKTTEGLQSGTEMTAPLDNGSEEQTDADSGEAKTPAADDQPADADAAAADDAAATTETPADKPAEPATDEAAE